ncbi:LacI family DNA-binding transcriptional regulator [Georgenia phoenicis]|uniref:LacI family DNA-binding transcriptional regulator n=1 Tax=unclassified Georgenia TaxID=2626815 RepID=UPI0039AF6729
MRNRFPSETRRPTIEDVARLAGVSKGTVSKFINGGDYYVAKETQARIAAAVAELEFQPNAIARDLVRRRTNTVGVIVANIANPLYPEIIAAVSEELDASDFTVLFGSSDGSAAKEADLVRSMRQRQVDGIIIASVRMDSTEVARLVGADVDVVLVSRNLREEGLVSSVIVDNQGGAGRAVRHLVEHGHARIAHIAGPQDVVPFADRREAYQRECLDAGVDVDPSLLIVARQSSHEAGAEAVNALLDLPSPPTAVFVGSDTMAMGVLEACDRRRVSVPRDLAVVSFDNVWVGRMPGVQLTSVDSRSREIGRLAAKRLVARIEARWRGDDVPPAATLTLPTDLVVRRTCGCVPG